MAATHMLISLTMANEVSLRVVRKVGEVSRERWDALVGKATPFLKWDWLDSLEQAGCVTERTGWMPHHIVVEKGVKLVAACPMYLKLHSMGEFVFDYEWAQAAHQAGIQYYPKMLVGVPFTPVTGHRFLTAGGEERQSLIQFMGQALAKIAADNKISSVHVNFCLEDELEVLKPLGFLPKVGLQFHWQNRGYQSFDDYLGSFRSDRRTKIKKERRELSAQGITVRAVEGDDLTSELLKTMFQLYKGHVDQHVYGRQYLNARFFEELSRRFRDHVCLIVAERDSRVIAGTFNIQDRVGLYGRYWGAFEDHRFLHFNVCYYAAIEHCVQKGLSRFEAGAGGSFKSLRGLEPQQTLSTHYILDPRFRRALQTHLEEEKTYTVSKQEALSEKSPLKKRG